MTSPECLQVAAQLDEHHMPETNGRIPVCHTCGARTDGPRGSTTYWRKVDCTGRPSGWTHNHGFGPSSARRRSEVNNYIGSSPAITRWIDVPLRHDHVETPNGVSSIGHSMSLRASR